LHPYSFAKKNQRQTVIGEKLHKALSYKKGMQKVLMKLTPGQVILHWRFDSNGVWSWEKQKHSPF